MQQQFHIKLGTIVQLFQYTFKHEKYYGTLMAYLAQLRKNSGLSTIIDTRL